MRMHAKPELSQWVDGLKSFLSRLLKNIEFAFCDIFLMADF